VFLSVLYHSPLWPPSSGAMFFAGIVFTSLEKMFVDEFISVAETEDNLGVSLLSPGSATPSRLTTLLHFVLETEPPTRPCAKTEIIS